MSVGSAIERSRARRQQSQKEALAELQELEDRAQQVANNMKSRPRQSTAVEKWEFAHEVAAEVPCVEAWGSGNRHVVGAYSYVPPPDGPHGEMTIDGVSVTKTPVYQSALEPDKWLYVSLKGYWFMGGTKSKDSREQLREGKACLRSASQALPGVLPHTVDGWQVMNCGEMQPREKMKFWLRETVQVEWQKLRLAACESPVISVRETRDARVDGLFDYVPGEGGGGEPPVFQHQRCKDSWLYLGSDQQWWIGSTEDKNRRAPEGTVKTVGAVQPGMHPGDAPSFAVLTRGAWQQLAVQVQVEPDELRACDKWAEAIRRGSDLELWGHAGEHGLFCFEEAAGRGAAPPRYRSQGERDTVLFVSEEDSRWWLGTVSKSGKFKEGRIRSAEPVEPGTLPDEVEDWDELQAGERDWAPVVDLRFHTAEGVKDAWRKARAKNAAREVLRLEGSPAGLDYGGLYDYMEVEGRADGPPCFVHQMDTNRWIFLGHDGRWWIGTEDHKQTAGRLRGQLRGGEAARPGGLPTDVGLWEAWSLSAKRWEPESGIKVVFSTEPDEL